MAVSVRAASATWTEITADQATVPIPTSPAPPQAGDRMWLLVSWKDVARTLTISGWTSGGTAFADGAVAAGNGTGSMKVQAFYRDWQSGDTAPVLDWDAITNLLARAAIIVLAKAADETWDPPVFRSAAWPATSTTQTVAASASASVPDGSAVLAWIGLRDNLTITRPTTGIDDSGGLITWNGDHVQAPATNHSTTTGNDGAGSGGYRLVTDGAINPTLRVTATISAAETGAVGWIIQDVTVSGPTTHALAAALDGAGAATAAAARQATFEAALAGEGSPAGALGLQRPIAAALDGAGAVTGETFAFRMLNAALAGEGELDGAADRTLGLGAVLSGAGAASSEARLVAAIAAALSGAGSSSAALGGIWPVAGALAGSGTLAGALGARRELAAAIAGNGALVGDVRKVAGLAAALLGSGSIAGALAGAAVLHALAATVAGAGAVTGAPAYTFGLASGLAGDGALAGLAAPIRGLAGAVAGEGSIDALPAALRGLAAELAGQGAVAATVGRLIELAADLAGAGELDAALAILGELAPGFAIVGVIEPVVEVGAIIGTAVGVRLPDAAVGVSGGDTEVG